MDIKKLLLSLNAHKVIYVIIGASAFPVHGYDRATQDFDIFIKATEENAMRTKEALAKIGYDVTDLTIEDLLNKKVLLRQYILDTDIHPFVTGASFESVWKNKVKGYLEKVPAYFASLKDLIKMKKAAGRPKDLEDLRYLEEIKRLKNKKKKI